MKKLLLIVPFYILSIFGIGVNAHTINVKVNVQNSKVLWKGSKITKSHDGYVNLKSGSLVIDHGTIVGGVFNIDMSSIKCTDIESEEYSNKLVKHLKSDHFFNVESNPISSIEIKAAQKYGKYDPKYKDNIYSILANLTIKGITHPIIFDAEINLLKLDNGNYSYTANAKIVIDRTKWDIKYASGNYFKDLGDKAILDEIEFDISLESVK